MTFRADGSSSSIVIVCSCGWRCLRFDQVSSWRAAREHERAIHPGEFRARDSLKTALHRARHAAI